MLKNFVQVLERKQLLPVWPPLEQLLPRGQPEPSLVITGAPRSRGSLNAQQHGGSVGSDDTSSLRATTLCCWKQSAWAAALREVLSSSL